MAANMTDKTIFFAYIRSLVSYNNKWSIKFNIIKVKESIYHSGNTVGMLLSKMAANMAAKTQNYVYFLKTIVALTTAEADPRVLTLKFFLCFLGL